MPATPEIIAALNARLAQTYGPRPLTPRGDAVSELIFTVLSQATNDRNRDRAYTALRRAFPTWEEAMAADPGDVARAIAPAGLGPQKAPRIIDILRRIAADPRSGGRPDLAFLGGLDDDAAFSYLTALPGVGPKTAACVLLFALGRPVFPVDTHIHRLAGRLGLVPPKDGAAKVQEALKAVASGRAAECYALHVNMIAHGRAVCRPRRPDCDHCSLSDLCRSTADSPTADSPMTTCQSSRRGKRE
ncbi:MAG TPA: endonuclease III [Bacillota bacterium]|jgi:endonuclease-3